MEAVIGPAVVDAAPDAEPDPTAVGREVGVSEARVPVRLYAAAHAARDIPCLVLDSCGGIILWNRGLTLGQHQVPPEASWVQKYPEAHESVQRQD